MMFKPGKSAKKRINYSMSAHTTIEETLVPFRGRTKFKMYTPSKPSKYGIKIMCLTDAHNAYLYDAYIYTGKGSDGQILTAEERKLKIPSQAVIRLTKSIHGTKRNVTCDNWFSSIELASELYKKQLTMVGTLNRNKPQIPPEFLPRRHRVNGSCLYGFTNALTLLSYVPKKIKQSFYYPACTILNIRMSVIISQKWFPFIMRQNPVLIHWIWSAESIRQIGAPDGGRLLFFITWFLWSHQMRIYCMKWLQKTKKQAGMTL